MAWPHENYHDSWGTSAAGEHASKWHIIPARALPVCSEGPLPLLYLRHTLRGGGLHPGPGELSIPHIDQGLVYLQSSWVRVFLHPLWGSPPRPVRGWAVELRESPGAAACPGSVLCALSGRGPQAPSHSHDPMVFKGN